MVQTKRAPDGAIYFSQNVPYEIRRFAPDGTLLQTIYRENDFISRPEVTRLKDGMTVTAPTASTSIVVLADGKILNVVKKPLVPEPPATTIIDLFDKNGELLTSRSWKRDMNIKCRDEEGHLYAIEMVTVPALVRYRIDMPDAKGGPE